MEVGRVNRMLTAATANGSRCHDAVLRDEVMKEAQRPSSNFRNFSSLGGRGHDWRRRTCCHVLHSHILILPLTESKRLCLFSFLKLVKRLFEELLNSWIRAEMIS